MKKGLYTLFALFSFSFASKAQIALTYDDTLICRGDEITMGASVTGQLDGTSGDDYFSPSIIDIGFPFDFYGQTYTQCLTSGNNFITFNLSYVGLSSSWTWAAATGNGQVDNAILLAFQDLDLNYGGNIQYQTFGSPGSRKFVVQYCDVPKYGGAACNAIKVTNQVILYEGSNIIEFHTQSMPGSPGCPSTNGTANAIQGVRWMSPTGINEVYTPNRGPADMWGNVGGTNTSRRFTPTTTAGGAVTYTVDSIAFNPWNIIQFSNSPLLTWYDANGNFLHQGATLTTTVSNPPPPAPSTFFIVEYTGPAGCDNLTTYTFRDTVHVRFSDIKTYVTAEMCAGSTYDFYGRTLFSPGVYDTTFVSQIGCDSVIILTLGINPLPTAEITNADKRAKICNGDRFIFSAYKAAGYQYQWYKDDIAIPGATMDTLGASAAGMYKVEVTTNKGCKKMSEVVELVIAPNPTVKINYFSSNDICAQDTVELKAMATGSNLEYIWTPDAYFRRTPGNAKASEVKAIIPKSGYVYVKVFNNDLCSATDSLYIKAEPCCEMTMPNAFTPNGDGKNDYFVPKLEVGQQIVSFLVFNRYGQLIYESNASGFTQGWDGRNKEGKEQQGGVYMYGLKYSCSDGKIYEKKGDITLMR
ncbi:MAG: gliding motility-associated C-terminal domain-containing protein [Taibaiella sp.]|nr:gliding motility-associated C-terminal domain-containing protein [Taibaiella sp.]